MTVDESVKQTRMGWLRWLPGFADKTPMRPEAVPRRIAYRLGGYKYGWGEYPPSCWYAERELWNTHLTNFQRKEVYETGFIPVRGSAGGYWIVPVHATGLPLRREQCKGSASQWVPYCLSVVDATYYDAVIARVLLIQADEKRFMRIANRFSERWYD